MIYWIVVAGPSQARIFAITGHYDTLHFIHTLKPERSFVSTNLAPADSTAGTAFAVENERSEAEAMADFAHELVGYLDKAFHKGRFHSFTLVAPRDFLDMTVRLLTLNLDKHLRKCVAEDRQALAAEQLQPMVHTMLPNLVLF